MRWTFEITARDGDGSLRGWSVRRLEWRQQQPSALRCHLSRATATTPTTPVSRVEAIPSISRYGHLVSCAPSGPGCLTCLSAVERRERSGGGDSLRGACGEAGGEWHQTNMAFLCPISSERHAIALQFELDDGGEFRGWLASDWSDPKPT